MIKTFKQAEQVQKRRVSAGLRGYAKAVRRYLLRDHNESYAAKKSSMEAYFGNHQ